MIEAVRPPQLGSWFSKFVDGAVDVVTAPASWAKELGGEIWQVLPKELREVAELFGPAVADVFLPWWGGIAADAALAILEGDRQSERARKAIKRAKAEGLIEDEDFDPDNRDHLIALAVVSGKITDPKVIEDLRARLPSNMATLAAEREAAERQAPVAALVAVGVLMAAGIYLPRVWR